MEKIYVFKTNISHENDYSKIKPVLDDHLGIAEWSIDREDVDKVLRVRSSSLDENDIVKLISRSGYMCNELV